MSNGRFSPGFRLRAGPLVLLLLFFFGLSLLGRVTTLITDYYWFEEVHLTPVFWRILIAKLRLGLLAGLAAGGLIGLNLWLAFSAGRRDLVIRDEDDVIQFPRLADRDKAVKWGALGAGLLLAYWIGLWASHRWETVLMFYQATPFGQSDPLLQKDAGFYVFSVPFYRLFSSWLTAVLVLSFLGVAFVKAARGEVRYGSKGMAMSPGARTHFLILGGLFCLLLAFRFHLSIYDLPTAQRAIAPGAGYTDVHAYLPGLKTLRILAVLSALVLWAGVWIPGNRLPLGAAALLVIGFIAVRGYREMVQRFHVAPNEISLETPYLKWAIEHTRAAFGVDAVQELEFDPDETLTADTLRRNDATVQNIRLWDHAPLLTTYSQLQEIRTYYEFLDVDNDRYMVNGQYRQVMLSPRELSSASLPSRIWINEHLTYTHGYGICLGPVNRITEEGLPEFFIKDIPPVSSSQLKVVRPEIYYGEAPNSYAIVNTKAKEFDYPSGEENVYSQYAGTGGVPLNGPLRKMLFSMRFREIKMLLSDDIMPDSRILFYRRILERAEKAAPFLLYDRDPYLILTDEGRLVWMIDAYTVTSRYPYSERVRGIGNYVRNSVKMTLDAYDGSLALYVTDPADPLIRTYLNIFPELFKSIDEMPPDIRRHIRYPQTLLAIQAAVYATYHMSEPQVFYNKEDLWKVPVRPDGSPMQPYYTIMTLAGIGKREEFILMVPFTPAKKENMIAWMAARCDDPEYGKLLVYNFPKQKLVYGPGQINSRIDQDPEISGQLTLWNQGGSRVIRGSLLVIPVEQSLLYVQPLYLESEGGGLPEAKRVIVAYGNTIAMERTLEASLERIFGRRPAAARVEAAPGAPPLGRDSGELARQARAKYERAQQLLRSGDWSGFGEELKSLGDLLKRLAEGR